MQDIKKGTSRFFFFVCFFSMPIENIRNSNKEILYNIYAEMERIIILFEKNHLIYD